MDKLTVPLATLLLLTACSHTENSKSTEISSSVGTIVRLDPAFDALVPQSAKIEKLADSFQFTEGPVWRPQGVLWFSDVVGNVVRQWSPDGKVTEILRPGGADHPDYAPPGSFIGPNGMINDRDDAVLLCQHGNRRIVHISRDRQIMTLVDRWEGKKLNSPNDLVYKYDGALYFTDPPYGLVKQDEDPTKEIKFNGVFRFAQGKLDPVIRDLTRPNGIAFSPDQKYLYIANSDEKNKVWMRYDVQPDGTVKNGKVFFDVTAEKEDGLPDGMKADAQGNLYCAGPGGIWVFSPDGKHLGTIKPGETPANCNWGDADHKTLYITARTGLYRIKLAVEGEKALYQ
ncbi:MAG TPA: SMP-30/gluconolactonase/LRE family protein [Bryobacteraceae bacterium]|nr:SMP-30/gluconolactonase/LRE family protein [Bryobacteraceae bacterium]